MIQPVSFARRSSVVVLGVGFAVTQVLRTPFILAPVELDLPSNCSSHSSHSADPELGEGTHASQPDLPASTTAAITSTDEITSRPSTCKAVVRRLIEWNDCWRRHLTWLKEQPANITKSAQKERPLCPVTDDTDSHSKKTKSELVGAPLYHFGYYQGQGFGRAIEHSTEACLAAFVLGRPCILNISPRDPYYTWRSFIHSESYQWDPSLLHSLPEYAQQLESLAQELPNLGSNEWDPKTPVNASKYSLVFPMQKKFDKKSWIQAIQYYHGTNRDLPQSHQVLFSPNWALVWFTQWPLAQIFREEYQCDYKELRTHMQNAMYGPTELARQLHQTRYNTASKSWKSKQNKQQPLGKQNEGRILPHITTTSAHNGTVSTINKNQEYGSIHLRLYFLNDQRKTPIKKGEVVTMVRSCLQTASEFMPEGLPQSWWLLADDSHMAGQVGQEFHNDGDDSDDDDNISSVKTPIVRLFHTYNVTSSNNQSKKLSSPHSMGAAAKGLFGQETMAGAVGDWMALHSSQVAIVTHAGSMGTTAFGGTGARGNGKVPRGYCGTPGKTFSDHTQPFEIFF